MTVKQAKTQTVVNSRTIMKISKLFKKIALMVIGLTIYINRQKKKPTNLRVNRLIQ